MMAHAPGGPRTLLAWAALAFVAAALQRLPLVNEGLFHHDEVVLARAVERSLAEGELHPAVKGRYGGAARAVVLRAAPPPHRGGRGRRGG
jgi:hypothetical protein